MRFIKKCSNKLFKEIRNCIKRFRLKNETPTIIAENCNGTFIYHDLNLMFRSPTINLYFSIKDFLKFVENLDYYSKCELREIVDKEKDYPVGELGDIVINFMHYKNFEEAKKKWNERIKRINKDNMFIIMNERDGCEYTDLLRFDSLPFKNKVVFTHKNYPEIKSSFYIKGFENKGYINYLHLYQGCFGKRYLDQFDYVKFLNKK